MYDSPLSTLHQMMGCLKETYLIVDGLRACGERQGLLTTIEELASWKDTNLHILITSRREKDVEESMESLTHSQEKIRIQSTLIDNNIRAYVHGRA